MRDGRAFDALVRAHAGAVSAYARALTGDRWLAEDATQETFLRAWKYLDSYDARGSFEGWLLRICRNCVIDLANRAPLAKPALHLPDVAEPADHRVLIYDALARLPIVQREVLVLCGLLGYDYAAAAALLDVPVGTVRSRLSRGRAGLARQLAPDEATA